MELEKAPLSVAIIGLTFLVMATMALFLNAFGNSALEGDGLGSSNFVYVSAQTLSPIQEGIIDSSFNSYNDTYLSCDGTNDYLRITPSSNDTLAFWYKGTTGAWQFVVDVMGTKYTNGTLDDPSAYPVYWNGTDYFFCKTDATTFWEGNIDKISVYDGQLNLTEVQTLYAQTRW